MNKFRKENIKKSKGKSRNNRKNLIIGNKTGKNKWKTKSNFWRKKIKKFNSSVKNKEKFKVS